MCAAINGKCNGAKDRHVYSKHQTKNLIQGHNQMHQGTLFNYLSNEEMELVLSAISIPSLSRLAATSRAHYVIVHRHIYHRLTTMLRPLFSNVQEFMAVLASTETVISGSQTLHFMMPPYNHSWAPADMDMYTSLKGYEELIKYMGHKGYKMISDGKQKQSDYTTGRGIGGIQFVTTMIRGDSRIDIIVSARISPIVPIFHFHSTVVTNFISAHGFFSAYPLLTEAYRGLINPNAFAPLQGPTHKIQGCIQKYSERGFDIRYNSIVWGIADAASAEIVVKEGEVPHDCHRSYMCPHTVRTTFDRSCMFIPFHTVKYMEMRKEKKHVHRTYRGRYGITWNIGGPSCDDTYDTMRPFVISTGSSRQD
jgi:hypothetical protein